MSMNIPKQFLGKTNIHVALSTLVLFTLLTAQTGRTEMVDRVMAVVNSQVITLSEVEEEAADAYRSIAKSLTGADQVRALDEARESALDSLINQALIVQRAEKFNITVSDEELERAFSKMRARNYPDLDDAEFKEALRDASTSEEQVKKHIRVQILQSKLISYNVRTKIVITDDMVLDYYDEHYTARTGNGRFYLLQIGIAWGADATEADLQERKKQAERIRQMALDGENFQKLAKEYSDLPSAVDGGDIGVFGLDDMASSMREAVGALAPGEVSEIIEMSNSYQFFKVLSGDEKAIVVTQSYESVKDEIKDKLYEEKLKESYAEWVRGLKDEAYIQKL